MSDSTDTPIAAPKPWIAAVLNLFFGALGLLYAGRPGLAILFFVLALACRIVGFMSSGGVELAAVVLELLLWLGGTVLAWRLAKSAAPGARPWYARWYGLLGAALAAVLCVYGFRMFFYEPMLVPSSAMLPTAGKGDRLLVQKFGFGHLSANGVSFGHLAPSRTLKRGELAVFDNPLDPRQFSFKRVVGVPGDVVEVRGNRLIVNGRDTRVAELGDYHGAGAQGEYVRVREELDGIRFETLAQKQGPSPATGPAEFPLRERCAWSPQAIRCTVPPGHYFMLGDHRDFSQDSRYFGFVRPDQVIGRIAAIYPQPELD